MTPQERKVFELALEALTHGGCPFDCKDGMTDSGGVHPWGEAALIPCANCQTITAIEEALAQPEQEPVAWMFQHDETGRMSYVSNDGIHDPTVFLEMNPRYALVCPLYTIPPQRTWVDLTDEEILEVWKENEKVYAMDRSRLLDRTRACIRKAQEKLSIFEKLERFQGQMEAVFNDFHGAL
jgi:hypothetical protein